jgi:hypothetical protein
MRRLVTLAVISVLSACASPHSSVDQGAANGLLTFPGAPADARVSLDGQDAGPANAYAGDHALSVKPGTHRVVVTTGGGTLLDKKYYVDAGAKVVVRND